jgi:outer membrane protein TolC
MTLLLALLLGLAPPARAAAPSDTLRLAALRAAAVQSDPRAIQPALLARAAALRIEALRLQQRPQLTVSGQATLQSDVPALPVMLPDGSSPAPPHAQLRLQAEADWAVLDGGRADRRADLEAARLAERTAGVDVALYGLREAVTDAFFGALLAQSQAATLAEAAADLDARRAFVEPRVAQGAALASDAAALEAERIGVQQRIDEADAARRAALAVLRDLTGLPVRPTDVLAWPALDGAPRPSNPGRARPEFAQADRTADRADAEARLAEAAARPAVSVFGQAGLGRPSPLDFLSDDLAPFGLVGVRVRWTPLDAPRARREAEAARLQADVAATEAEALARALRRQAEAHRATLDRLDAALPQDARVVALREEVLRVARRQMDEGVLPAPDYVDRLTDLATARLAAERHRIERAYAHARLLTTLGLFPDTDASPDR